MCKEIIPYLQINRTHAERWVARHGAGGSWLCFPTLDQLSYVSIRALAFNNIKTGASTFSANADNLQTKKSVNRYFGLAVRLIRDVD
jgi:hypothetical protein